MFNEGQSHDPQMAEERNINNSKDPVAETNENESELSYDAVFDKVQELGHIEDPKSYARSLIWRRYYDLVRNGVAAYDELFHEAVVGMYLAVQKGESVEKIEVQRSVGRQLEGYKYALIGRRQSIPFSSLSSGEAEDMPGEEIADRLRFRIKLEQVEDDTQEAVVNEDFVTDLMRQSRQIIFENGEKTRRGQGQKDWDVFVRYLTGDRIEEICISCPWLTSVDTAEKALQRIILNLRRNIDGAADVSTTVSILSEGKSTRTFQQDTRFDQREYYRKWYEENKEIRREQMREYMRNKRANS